MRAQTRLMIIVAAFLSTTSNAYALECESLSESAGGSQDDVICSSIPDEAPQTLLKTRSVDTSKAQSLSMLTSEETSGETDIDLDKMKTAEDLELVDVGSSALAEAENVQNQIRDIELFLKSGPAANGDLTVISAGAKDEQ